MAKSEAVQAEVLVRHARGDTRAKIAKDLTISPITVGNIVKRNQELLLVIKKQLIEHHIGKAERIFDKATTLVENSLSKAIEREERITELAHELAVGNITMKEWRAEMAQLPAVSLRDALAAATAANEWLKESPLQQTDNTDMKELMDSLKGADEVELQRIVFSKDDSQSSPEASKSKN